jgi:hypothetical protein
MLMYFNQHCFHPPPPQIPRCRIMLGPESSKSAKLFLQSSELGLPQPFTRMRVCPPPRFWGEGHTRWRERGWESPGTYTHYGTLYIYVLCGRDERVGIYKIQMKIQKEDPYSYWYCTDPIDLIFYRERASQPAKNETKEK